MLTPRGWAISLFSLFLTALALLDPYLFPLLGLTGGRYANPSLELLGLTVGGWFLWEWLRFALRARVQARRLTVERTVSDERGPVDTLWARRTFAVRVVLRGPAGVRFPFLRVTDRLPYGAELCEGEAMFEGTLEAGEVVELNYRVRCTAIGLLRFEGVRVQMADLQGFFYHAAFVPDVLLYRVLPPLADERGHSPTVKRHNLLPPPGVHRLRRSGSGSELLDLRDYLPGDPPKTIAWKASARRDRLITKEFESEVPLRCTLFVDASQAVRLGPPGATALDRLVEIAASVAQANASVRDLTGMCLFNETASSYIAPARGPRHLVEVIGLLTDAAGLAPTSDRVGLPTLLPLAYAFAEVVYPEQLRPEVNRLPEWVAWLWPQPAYTLRRPTFTDRLNQRLPFLVVIYAVSAALLMGGALAGCIALFQSGLRGRDAGVYFAIIGVVIALLAMVLFKVPAFFFPGRRRLYRWRKQLAALLSVRHGLAPGGLALLMEDEPLFIQHLQRFLSEHRVPYPLPRRDDEGRSLFSAPEKFDVLAAALLRSVRHGHDNELFVLMVDLLELADDIEPLIRAARVAVARHHQVMVVCPWPRGVPAPDRKGDAKEAKNPDRRRWERAFQTVRRSFARLGVPVVVADSGEPARLILERMERLRLLGRKR